MANDQINSKERLKHILSEDAIFTGFSHESRQLILRYASFRRFLSDQLILDHDQIIKDVYILLNGTLQVGWLQTDGQLKINNYIASHSVFNLVAFLQQKPLNYDYFAIGSVEISVIPGQLFLQQLRQQPEAMWHVLQLLSQRMYTLFEQSRYVHTANLIQRIAYHLNRLAIQYGDCQHNTCLIGIRITQQEFAELFGVSRQTLYKNLQFFLEQNILEWSYSQIRILDMAQLRKICDLD
ncbi:MAG: Crp/Fnr family transcriptional regulator [Acinetobacter populi]|jgi:CRP-like cAMP-binding protein|uniref:Crp/Fnr family transcriptional regulator n=1 Tax=Acinetobacter populi TaxID=1582270 RepID=UPI0023542413|nr:Crp/Fnr family transcriptional regulator [Acinetobacter populi]MCH4249077.1 Crp/Fnr family transcriptional regulator [Acinetobacter populi]